jgi:anti-anti-sigma factor
MPDSTEPTVFEVHREDVGRVSVVAVAGEIDLATADDVREALQGAPADAPLVLDLCEASFIDSSGLRVILLERQRRSGPLHLACAPAGPLTRIFEVSGLETELSIHPTRDAAVAWASLR